jgi:hypoxanthine-DNA glycosylase
MAEPDGRLQGLAPVLDRGVRLVVLGSFPGVMSLRQAQYYAHPRNQFWPIAAALLGVDLPALPYAERLRQLLAHGVGLWDVHAACRRDGSLDAAIEDPLPNDLTGVLGPLPELRGIAHNGGESARSMGLTRALGRPVWRLPSTSPAHAAWSLERKREAWRVAFEACDVGPAGGAP